MAGRGPAPKAGGKKGTSAAVRVVDDEACEAPPLPSRPHGLDWPEHTLFWWDSWVENPLTEDYCMNDWLDLIDCAELHAQFWANGNSRVAGELRQRMARHGATRDDRARLRIAYATAVQKEKDSGTTNAVGTSAPKSTQRYGKLSAAR